MSMVIASPKIYSADKHEGTDSSLSGLTLPLRKKDTEKVQS